MLNDVLEDDSMDQTKEKKNIWRKTGKIALKTVIFLLLFIVLLIGLMLIPPVQQFITNKATGYLEGKLGTKVSVGKLYIGFPETVVLEKIYVEDKQKDTLLYGGSIKIDVGLMDLILGNGVNVNTVALENITAKVKRELPDTAFNFQFIIDAFASKDAKPDNPADTSATPVSIGSVALNKIRVLYKDAVTGNDIEANLDHFDTKFDAFDPDKMKFAIGETKLNGLVLRAWQTKPLVVEKPEITAHAAQKEETVPDVKIREIDLQKIYVDYKNDVSALYALLNLGQLKIKPDKIDLSAQDIDLGDILLSQTTAAVRLGKTDTANIAVKQPEASSPSSNWKIRLASLQLDHNNIRFDDDNAPHQKEGMDFMHLEADDLVFHVNNFLYSNDAIAGKIEKASFTEKSGFALQQLRTDFLYSGKQAYLKDLFVKTPGTELKRELAIQYASIDDLKKNIGDLQLDLNVQNSKVQVKDILTFVPSLRTQPAFADPNATWLLDGNIRGRVSDMFINNLQVSGLKDTRVAVKGRITGLPDADKIKADLTIYNISSSKKDILSLVPAHVLPPGISLPDKIALNGKINGGIEKLTTDLKLNTDLGNASLKGATQNITDAHKAIYDVELQTQSLDLGTILQDKNNFGPVTASFNVKGKGYDLKTANASLQGQIRSAIIKQYNYQGLNINGTVSDQKANLHAGIADPNIRLSINAKADMSKQYPAVQVDAVIDSIKLKELHFTKDAIVYRGNISGDFSNTNPDSLEGKLFILESLLVHNQQRIQMDTIQLLAAVEDTVQHIIFNSDILNAELRGKYKLTEMASVMQNAVEPYFATDTSHALAKAPAPYDFTISARLVNKPVLKALIDSLQRLDTVTVQSHFSDSGGWNAIVKAPAIKVGANVVNDLVIKADAGDTALTANMNAAQIAVGNSIAMYATNVTADVANNNIDFSLNIKDKAQKDKYNLKGLFRQFNKEVYMFSLKPENLLLNYDTWTIADSNKIVLDKGDIHATDFTLDHSGEQLSINSTAVSRNAPLDISFNNFKIATLTGFAQQDSTLADGILNGKATVTDITTQPVFVGDLTVNDLSIKKDTVGNIKLLVNNKVKDTYNADVRITGNGNDVSLNGNYFANTGSFDFLLDMKQFPMKTAEAFSGGAIKESSGGLNGRFDIKGTTDKPSVNGDLNFNKVVFNLSMLNNIFKIDQEKIAVSDEGIRFNNFQVKDSAGNGLSINGLAGTGNFTNYNLNLDVKADNFQALNSAKADNKLFYGKLFFDSRLNIKGTESAPVVDGRLTINDKTKMTVVLPQNDPGVADREGVVVFVDKDSQANDSLFLANYDSLNTSSMQGMDISVNISVDKAADFTLIVDEGSGDFLNVRGGAELNAGIDPGGKINLTGSYELEEGSYELTFNFLKRKFDIVKGSKIVWEGEPTDANVDITAKYTANTSPLDLVKNQLGDIEASQRNTYLQKLPFSVLLKMSGKLLKPQISFDITLPENENLGVSNDVLSTVKTKLEMLRNEDAEMNKQVFALLLLNRFVAEDPFRSSTGTSTSTLVKQSVSKLMTEQLNKLAADLIKGVELNFDVEASDDYTTGQRESRTDLNVGLSKRLLNDRLTVTVGSNFELEGPQNSDRQASNIAGNVSLNYRLSEDGRYMLRGYRKNEYQGIIEGYVVETGVGFIITMDYNRFREIFENRKAAAERRKMRRESRRAEKQNDKDAGIKGGNN